MEKCDWCGKTFKFSINRFLAGAVGEHFCDDLCKDAYWKQYRIEQKKKEDRYNTEVEKRRVSVLKSGVGKRRR